VKLRISDVSTAGAVSRRAIVMQQKTSQPVQFEITKYTRQSVEAWMVLAGLAGRDYLFKSRLPKSDHISTRQYARIVNSWVEMIGLAPAEYGAHSLRRTKATLIYRRTKISALFSCCLATQKSKALCDISG
jgi:integrase